MRGKVVDDTGGKVTGMPRPEDIPLIHGMLEKGLFGKCEVEISAARLVLFFRKEARGWVLFTLSKFMDFYRENNWNPDDILFGLAGSWFDDGPYMWHEAHPCIAFYPGGQCVVTEEFIQRCAGTWKDPQELERPELTSPMLPQDELSDSLDQGGGLAGSRHRVRGGCRQGPDE